MSDHASFLAAILAGPEDDLPRLIYADWLDDRGDPRGEFIRLQIAAHHGDEEAGRAALVMEREHARAWHGPLASWAYQVGYSRGFAESIVIRGDQFLAHVGRIFRLAPIRHVSLIGVRNALGPIVRLPQLAYLSALHLSGCGLGDREAQKLADCIHLKSLRSLRLANNEISCSGTSALATSENLTELRHLSLATNDIGDWGARALAATRSLTNLESLDLAGNVIGPSGDAALRRSAALLATQISLAGQRQPWEETLHAAVS